jgi:Ca-activated chloride channel homolog
MSFQQPLALLGLLVIPLLLGGYLLLQRRRSKYAVRFTNLELLADVAPRTPSWRRHVPPAIYLLALAALVVALARPEIKIEEPKEQATVMMTMDVSRSMEATDVKPNRLTAAQEAGRNFIDRVPEDFRLGVVTFSGGTQVLAPPTTDREVARDAIDRLQPESGTAMGDGIIRSLQTGGRDVRLPNEITPDTPENRNDGGDEDGKPDPLVILLLSDGANTAGTAQPDQAAALARREKVPVYTIALGTENGTVEVPNGFGGTQSIEVPPDPDTLREISRDTGGRFFSAPNAADLEAVFERLGSSIGYTEELTEITWLFAALGLLALVTGGGLAAVWFNRFP